MSFSSSQETTSLSQRITENKGVTFSLVFGSIFVVMEIMDNFGTNITSSGPVYVMMQTILLIILFLGMMIFIYNFGYLVIMLAIDEGLNDDEVVLLKWTIRRAALISVVWFAGVIIITLTISHEPFLTAGLNCYLLALLFYTIRKGENPLVEGVSI